MTSTTASSRDALPAGTRLMDYDIEGLLGAGGFGLVYRARDAALQRTVAIKEYLPTALAMRADDGHVVLRSSAHEEPFALGLRSFINEARLLARFDHPSLVKVFRFWEAKGTAYMVMPCYEGPTLYDARRQLDGPPEEAWLRALMDPLLGALDCLHREQVFHRDVAPDNILVVQDRDAPCGFRPVLLDFGAARRVINENTQALTAILKPSFAPIEQYAETTQLRQGPWTDLYGLAAVLHYCITGRTPVPATARAVHDDLPVLQQMAPALARDFGRHYSLPLLATIDHALAVKPGQRPASAAAWRESLLKTVAPLAPAVPLDHPSTLTADGGTAAIPGPPAVGGRDDAVWTERTVVVGSGAHGAGSDVLASGLFAAEPAPVRPVPTSWWWIGGAAVLAAVVTLAAWTVKRQAPAGVVASGGGAIDMAVAAASSPLTPPTPGRSQPARPAADVVEEVIDHSMAPDQPGSGAWPARPTEGAASSAPPVRVARSDAPRGPLNPRQACGNRVFIAMAICMKRYCGKPQYTHHAECARMREQEEAQRQYTRGIYP